MTCTFSTVFIVVYSNGDRKVIPHRFIGLFLDRAERLRSYNRMLDFHIDLRLSL